MPVEDWPRNFSCDETNRNTYAELTDRNQTLSPFRGKEFADVFSVAMAIGFKMSNRIPLKKLAYNIPFSALKEREWLIDAIAIADAANLDILLDTPRVVRIVEEYANGGIERLKEIVFGGLPGDARKRIEAELMELLPP